MPIKSPWVTRAPRWQIVAVSLLAGFSVWVCTAGFDVLAANLKGLSLRLMETVDVLVGLVVAILVSRTLLASKLRHHRITQNLEIVAELNHRIRNALVRLQLAAYLSDQEQTITHIRESTSCIDLALRELLPEAALRVGSDRTLQKQHGGRFSDRAM